MQSSTITQQLQEIIFQLLFIISQPLFECEQIMICQQLDKHGELRVK